jgi:hypothetical protein
VKAAAGKVSGEFTAEKIIAFEKEKALSTFMPSGPVFSATDN